MADEKKKDDKNEPKAEKAELSPEELAAKSKKKRLFVIIVAGVLGLGGVGGGLAVVLGGGESKAEAPKGEGGEKKEEHGGHASGTASGHGEKKEETKEEHGGHASGTASGHGEEKKEGHGEEKKEEHGEAAKKDDKKDAKSSKLEGVDFGCTQPLQPFHLNLGNPLENRYIRLEVALEYGCAEESKAEIEKRLPQLRDAIISVTSRKTREFLLGPDGKEQLRKEIHNRVNHYMTSKIDDVFITDILIE